MKTLALAALTVLLSPLAVLAEIKTATIEYKDGDVTCKGFIAYDETKLGVLTGAKPGVLIVPEWWGLTEYPKMRAKQLAELGYVAFVADIYGDGKTTDDAKEAGALATPFKKDSDKFRPRVKAALDTLRAEGKAGGLDPQKIAAIGYCFGGSAVLELARSGAAIDGVVSFHGDLATPAPAKAGDVKAKVLVCTGADDAFVKPSSVEDFGKEMKTANVDYQIISYGGAHHAFTNPDADRHHIDNIAYNKAADERSWQAMKDFFGELFKK